MPIFSCLLSFNAEQIPVTSRHRRMTMLGISRLGQPISRWLRVRGAAVQHLPSILRNRWAALTARVSWKQTDWRHAWLVTGGMTTFAGLSALSLFSLLKHVPWLFLKLPSAGPPTQRRPPTSRNWSWSQMTAVAAPSPHETTHRHNTSQVTRPRYRVYPDGAAAAVVSRNRPHPFKCCRRRRCGRAAGRSCYSIDVCFAPGL